MGEVRDWSFMRDMPARLLMERTGQDAEAWNRRIAEEGFTEPASLRAWLKAQGVSGYPQAHLVREQFGYPDFMLASADELIEGQYADRPALRPILDALIETVSMLEGTAVQARKTYVSLLTPRRTFARVQPTTRRRIDLGLRLHGRRPAGRLQPCRIHETMPLQISFAAPGEVDAEALDWLRQAYEESC